MERSKFLKQGLLLGGAVFITTGFNNKEEVPLIEKDEIDEFVGVAHNSLEKTQKMLKANPLILNGASQLAKGDFETALGGASHMGRKDIADLLISHGARMDIFTFAFLGYSELVKQLVKRQPQLLNSYGPHGFTLLHHAKVGKQTALANWIESQGLTKEIFDDVFDF